MFSRFGPVWLLFVSKHEKVTRWIEIFVEWGSRRRHRGLFCRPRENVFFRRVQEVRASLGQVYRAKRRLRWEIKRHLSKIFVFLLKAKYLSDHPRIYFTGSETLPSACYILFDEYSIQFYSKSNGYKKTNGDISLGTDSIESYMNAF